MKSKIKETLVEKVNKSKWWHVTPQDSGAYKKRGKFLASTYKQAEFYGRPNDDPERVFISNPIYGKEPAILKSLFPNEYKEIYRSISKSRERTQERWYLQRINLDAKMYKRAKMLGYDAIIILGESGREALAKGRKPGSLELNILNV